MFEKIYDDDMYISSAWNVSDYAFWRLFTVILNRCSSGLLQSKPAFDYTTHIQRCFLLLEHYCKANSKLPLVPSSHLLFYIQLSIEF